MRRARWRCPHSARLCSVKPGLSCFNDLALLDAQQSGMHPSGTPAFDTFNLTHYTSTMQHDSPKRMNHSQIVAISAAACAATRVLR